MPIIIRKTEASDCGRIASMQFRSENEVELVDMPYELKSRVALSVLGLEAIWAERFDDEYFESFVAIDDDSYYLCGCVGISIFKGIGYIRSLYIDPGYLRLGIGTALLNTALRRLKEASCDIIRLEVLENNVAAIKLYRNFGFKFKRFHFPLELGGSAQAIFPNFEYKVRQMEVAKDSIVWQ